MPRMQWHWTCGSCKAQIWVALEQHLMPCKHVFLDQSTQFGQAQSSMWDFITHIASLRHMTPDHWQAVDVCMHAAALDPPDLP